MVVIDTPNPLPADRDPDERGASLIEYSLLIAFIAVVSVVAMAMLGQQTNETLSTYVSAVSSAGG